MKTAAIIAEYNPFHNGHKFLAQKANELGYDGLVAVMSGNWVQRGDTAVISKFARTKQALECGIDLVAELPTYWAMATAQKFAKGAVDIIASLNVDALVFGSECGDITKLMQTVYTIRSKDFEVRLRSYLDSGLNLAKARETVVEELCGNGELLRSPNDTLAIEYINAAKDLNLNIKFHAIKRVGAEHDSDTATDIYCSASQLRNFILSGNIEKAEKYMPAESFEILKDEYKNGKISDLTRLEKTILAVLRSTSKEEYKALPDISEGIESRLFGAARMSSNFNGLMEYTATKRYTNARLRRLILSAFLKEKKDEIPSTVPYIRVLGCDKKGAEILQNARNSSKLPIIMRSTSLKDNACFKFEERATDIYSLSQFEPSPCGEEYTNGIITKK